MYFIYLLSDDTGEPGEGGDEVSSTAVDKKDELSPRSDSPASQQSVDSPPTLVPPTTTTSILTTLHRDRSSGLQQKANSPIPHSKRRRPSARSGGSPVASSHQLHHDDVEHSIPANLIQDPSSAER